MTKTPSEVTNHAYPLDNVYITMGYITIRSWVNQLPGPGTVPHGPCPTPPKRQRPAAPLGHLQGPRVGAGPDPPPAPEGCGERRELWMTR